MGWILLILLVAASAAAIALIRPYGPLSSRRKALAATAASGLSFFAVAGAMPRVDVRSEQQHVRSLNGSGLDRARWVAAINALACGTLKNIESLEFLDAVGAGDGVRNPASDGSQAGCISVRRGAPVVWRDTVGGKALVDVDGCQGCYMLRRDLSPQ